MGRKVALLVGCDHYEDPNIQNLMCAEEDAHCLRVLLQLRAGFDTVELLRRPTNEHAVLDVAERLTRGLAAGDLFLFFFAGHGVELDGRHLLLMPQVRWSRLRYGPSHAVPMNALKDVTRGPADRAFILDACRSELLEGKRGMPPELAGKGALRTLVEQVPAPTTGATVVLCSCEEKEMATELPEARRGLFSLAFEQIMAENLAAERETRLDDALQATLSARMLALAESHGISGAQRPWIAGGDRRPVLAPGKGKGTVTPPPSRMAVLEVASDPPGALVAVDGGAWEGTAPCHFTKVPWGPHLCFGELAGERVREPIEITDCKHTVNLRFPLGELRRCIEEDVAECVHLTKLLSSPKSYLEKLHTSHFPNWRQAGELGWPQAQWLLGLCFAFGIGVEEDDQKAVEWILKAAEQGFAPAQAMLGACCAAGTGVEEDEQKAVEWILKAAEQGFAPAQMILGTCYAEGMGVAKDEREAAAWYRAAAELGDMDAQFSLGLCYAVGTGVAKDEREAAKWYRKAAVQGDADAQCNLGLCYAKGTGVAKDEQEAAIWLRRAAEQGDADAQYNLGVCDINGIGVKKDEYKAAEWFHKAAEQGHAPAQYNLGICYLNGEGVAKSKREATKWFRKAAEQGDDDAKQLLESLD